jgi:hypothetical protein
MQLRRWTIFLSTNTTNPEDNGAVLNLSQIIKAVTSSATKAELGALYINTCETSPSDIHLKKWDTSNPQCQYKPTTAQHLASSTITSNRDKGKEWTCISIGYNDARRNNNSNTSGARATPITQTIGQNTTAQHNTRKNKPKSSPQRASSTHYALPSSALLSLKSSCNLPPNPLSKPMWQQLHEHHKSQHISGGTERM